ncbi:MAG: hypothetical protein Q4C96_04195 [Planctomycetia bacterium]|nr:hypothetical protein [Planctomycetia bacterium]
MKACRRRNQSGTGGAPYRLKCGRFPPLNKSPPSFDVRAGHMRRTLSASSGMGDKKAEAVVKWG